MGHLARIVPVFAVCLVAQWGGSSGSQAASMQDAVALERILQGTCGARVASRYPWKRRVLTTCFWIGADANRFTSTLNFDSAWDTRWFENYGGSDDPHERKGFRPAKFFPSLNPFYVALPFNDRVYPDKARRWVPWLKGRGAFKGSVCKGRWVAVHHGGKVAFGTWEDVGPFRTDHAEYVFGSERPNNPTGAGLDVSPAIRDYLGLKGTVPCDWRFVEAHEVPYGPWLEYGEKALVNSLVRDYKAKGKKLPPGAERFRPE